MEVKKFSVVLVYKCIKLLIWSWLTHVPYTVVCLIGNDHEIDPLPPDPRSYMVHTGSKFEMDVATFGLDFLEECTTQGRTRSPSDGVPLFQGSFCSIIPWPIRWHEYDTLQMILGIFRHHGAHSCRLSGSNNLLMWLAQHGCLRTELNQFVANS